MDTALYVGLAHKSVLKRKMDVVAHNIANMNTTAFKKEKVQFKEFLMDAPGTLEGKIASVIDFGVSRSTAEGTLISTNNPLDIFISGDAYLSVEGKDGNTYYTRNGRMSLDADSNLVLLSGEKVLDDSGAPISFDEEEIDIMIAKDGTLSTNIGEKGKIGFKTFANEQAMKRVGTSLYKTDQAPKDAEEFQIHQRAIEGSNVNAIEEMTQMIAVQRAYENASKSNSGYEKMRKDSLDRMAKVR